MTAAYRVLVECDRPARFSIDVIIEKDSKSNRREMPMSESDDFIRELAGIYNTAEEDRKRKEELILHDKQLLQANAKVVWEDLRASIKENVDKLNQELGGKTALVWKSNRSLEISLMKDGDTLEGTYDPSRNLIIFKRKQSSYKVEFTLRVDGNEVVICHVNPVNGSTETVTKQDVVQGLL